MPVYSIQLPDQRTLDIEAADPQTALQGAQEWHQANPIPVSTDVEKSVGQGIKNAVIGNAALVGDIPNTGIAIGKFITDKLGFTDPNVPAVKMPAILPTSEGYKAALEPILGKDYVSQTPVGSLAKTATEFVPQLASPGGALRKVGTYAASVFGSEGAGQAAKALDLPEYEAAARLVGGVVPALLSGGRGANVPTAERQAARDVLNREGVTDLTAGQITGNANQRYKESVAGGAGQAMEESQQRQLTEAAVKQIGETGDNVHEAVQRARPRIGQMMENAAQRMTVRMDQRLGNDLVNIDQELLKEGLDPNQINRILAQRNNVVDAFNTVSRGNKAPDTLMTGTAFHNLIRTGSPLQRAIDSGDSTVSYYANRIREALFDAAERTAHGQGTRAGTGRRQAFEDLGEARRQWANMRALEEASSGPGAVAAGGQLTPAALRKAATNRDTTDYARGRGDFNELARAANLIMAPLPNSGTAQRLLSMQPGRALGTVLGTVAGGLAGSPLGFGALGPAAIGAAIGNQLGPALQARYTMSRLGQFMAGNRPARFQPAPLPPGSYLMNNLLALQPASIPLRDQRQ